MDSFEACPSTSNHTPAHRTPKLQRITWARLLKRVGFAMETCPECGALMKVVQCVLAAEAIRKIAAQRRAVQIDPSNSGAYTNLGVAYSEQGRYEDAIPAFQEAIRLDTKNGTALGNLGASLLLSNGPVNEACDALEKAIELVPEQPDLHMHLGLALMRKELPAKAFAAFERAIELAPKDSEMRNAIGVALMESGARDEAMREFDRAIELDPDNSNAKDNLDALSQMPGPLEPDVLGAKLEGRVADVE